MTNKQKQKIAEVEAVLDHDHTKPPHLLYYHERDRGWDSLFLQTTFCRNDITPYPPLYGRSAEGLCQKCKDLYDQRR